MLTNGWDVSKRGRGFGVKEKIEMTEGFDGPPRGEDQVGSATSDVVKR